MPSQRITAGVPNVDGCPSLKRMKVYVTQVGIVPVLEHTFRDSDGNPLDISDHFPDDDSSAGSEGSTGSASVEEGTVGLRSKELISNVSAANNPIIAVNGVVISAEAGLVRFPLKALQVKHAGIYQLSMGIRDADENLVHIENPLLWVERSLFATDDPTYNLGPPTIMEIREAIYDTGAADNLLLDEMEFSDDQLASAAGRPLQEWNAMPPPLRPQVSTKNFPFREMWMRAICGHLFRIAAHNYRRNTLPYQAGGLSINDKDKEQPYMQIGMALQQEWREWMMAKKVEINQALFVGAMESCYGFH